MRNGLNRLAVLTPIISLAACAATADNIYGGAFGQNVTGNAVSVSVTNVWNQADAMPLADRHCGQYGKAARFSGMSGNTASFDCITP